jgi:murein L,D-transpeptidase YafK
MDKTTSKHFCPFQMFDLPSCGNFNMKNVHACFIYIFLITVCVLPEFAFANSSNATVGYAIKTKVNRTHADWILVEKRKRKMTLFSGSQVLREYRVALGTHPKGPKVMEGDGRTPEGIYFIDYRVPDSQYHLALHISYPEKEDIQRASRMGVSPGGNIMLHGLRNGAKKYLGSLHNLFDWTDGCIAVSNKEIEDIWNLVRVGTLIEIRP